MAEALAKVTVPVLCRECGQRGTVRYSSINPLLRCARCKSHSLDIDLQAKTAADMSIEKAAKFTGPGYYVLDAGGAPVEGPFSTNSQAEQALALKGQRYAGAAVQFLASPGIKDKGIPDPFFSPSGYMYVPPTPPAPMQMFGEREERLPSSEWEKQTIKKDDEGWYWHPTHPDRFETEEDARHNQRYWVNEHKRTGARKVAEINCKCSPKGGPAGQCKNPQGGAWGDQSPCYCRCHSAETKTNARKVAEIATGILATNPGMTEIAAHHIAIRTLQRVAGDGSASGKGLKCANCGHSEFQHSVAVKAKDGNCVVGCGCPGFSRKSSARKKANWTYQSNIPGYLPMADDPFITDDWKYARDALLEDLDRARDHMFDAGGDRMWDTYTEAIEEAKGLSSGEEWSTNLPSSDSEHDLGINWSLYQTDEEAPEYE
jgi:hypothetical protein